MYVFLELCFWCQLWSAFMVVWVQMCSKVCLCFRTCIFFLFVKLQVYGVCFVRGCVIMHTDLMTFMLLPLQWGRPCDLFHLDREFQFCSFDWVIGSVGVQAMGKCKCCGKLGRIMPRDGFVSPYHFSLLLSPLLSVWDCIVRKMRYSFRPEWV